MAINRMNPDKWKEDIAKSVDFYNGWFMEFAPKAYRDARMLATGHVEKMLEATDALRDISFAVLNENPGILSILRMSTCPPIARDRLIGLTGVPRRLVECMEAETPMIPRRMDKERLEIELNKIAKIITLMADSDIFVWLRNSKQPTNAEIDRAATIIADRLCGAISDPIIRNAQEKRQLSSIESWLVERGYRKMERPVKFDKIEPGTFSFRTNVPVIASSGEEVFKNRGTISFKTNASDADLLGNKKINVPVDVIIMPISAKYGEFPLLIEAKSAGDFTNVNKRRKEEAQKMAQLRRTYGNGIRYGLFLCGYFDLGYLGYEAGEGIDWIWEHRMDDLALYGL
ncbi:MAG: XamI family restriction endonuclease [Methanomassiliicoccaceae archaeon]|nr:XamI family restriction endonuclease [Methanomassiliicoccaceae archaeon]